MGYCNYCNYDVETIHRHYYKEINDLKLKVKAYRGIAIDMAGLANVGKDTPKPELVDQLAKKWFHENHK